MQRKMKLAKQKYNKQFMSKLNMSKPLTSITGSF